MYSPPELQEMKEAISFCKSAGVEGVVFGVLQPDNQLDIPIIQDLARLAHPMEVTIHRAIDDTPDVLEAVRQLKRIPEVNCILSAGKAASAAEGYQLLHEMVLEAGPQLKVIPAGGVTNANVAVLHRLVGAAIYHGTRIVGKLQ